MKDVEYLYVIHAEDVSACKVGRSNNPTVRTRNIIKESNIKKYSVFISEPILDSCVCEKAAHNFLSGHIHLNEWYFCEKQVAIEAVKNAVKNHGCTRTERVLRAEKKKAAFSSIQRAKIPEKKTQLCLTLRSARMNSGMHQSDVARELGVNITTVSSWETGKTRPSLENFRKMCRLYGCPEDMIRF